MTVVTWLSSYFGDRAWSFVLTLFILNIVSASFDVSVDIVAMDILQKSQLSLGSAVQVGSYKVGAIFGGGVLFLLQLLAGVKGILRGMSVTYALGLAIVTFRSGSNAQTTRRTEEDGAEETPENEKTGAGDAGSQSPEGLRRRKMMSEKVENGAESKSQVATDVPPEPLLEKFKWVISVDGTRGSCGVLDLL
uniref:Putative conserved plasma membrane protein n=1 Tax=Amblyomma triste TaxID=251400 RepID=A0A023GAH8_AMBTT